jgi:hypothetical protein
MDRDRYRLPASYGLIGGMLFQQHVQTLRAEAERQELIDVHIRFWAWKVLRAFAYLAGGVAALLYVNDGFAWTAAMTAGAGAAGCFALLWIGWVGRVDADFEEGPILLMWLVSAGAHIAVLVWGWIAYGAATAVPWLFIGLGALGFVSGAVEIRKNSLLR